LTFDENLTFESPVRRYSSVEIPPAPPADELELMLDEPLALLAPLGVTCVSLYIGVLFLLDEDDEDDEDDEGLVVSRTRQPVNVIGCVELAMADEPGV